MVAASGCTFMPVVPAQQAPLRAAASQQFLAEEKVMKEMMVRSKVASSSGSCYELS